MSVMELIKNIAAVVGCITTCVAFIGMICKPLRKAVVGFIRNHAGRSEIDKQLAEMRQMLDDIQSSLAITVDFTEKQCRNITKNIFYHYKDTKVLPLYEKKTLLDIQDLYVTRMKKNHWGKTLLGEMFTWETDCSGDVFSSEEEDD